MCVTAAQSVTSLVDASVQMDVLNQHVHLQLGVPCMDSCQVFACLMPYIMPWVQAE